MKRGGIRCESCGHSSGVRSVAAVVLLAVIIGAAAGDPHALTVVAQVIGHTLIWVIAAGALAATLGLRDVRLDFAGRRNRRISPLVRAVITDARAGRLTFGQIPPGSITGRPAWRPGEPWELAGAAGAYSRLLIGDADRERLIAVLREHYAAGRLSLDELSRRVAVALTARYADEADAALAELPRGMAGGER